MAIIILLIPISPFSPFWFIHCLALKPLVKAVGARRYFCAHKYIIWLRVAPSEMRQHVFRLFRSG